MLSMGVWCAFAGAKELEIVLNNTLIRLLASQRTLFSQANCL